MRETRVAYQRFGILCVLGYVALSWAFRFDLRRGEQIASLVYPFDTFSMYARVSDARVGHLLLIDERGEAHRVLSFTTFECRWPVETPACVDHSIKYHDDDLMHHIASNAGTGGTPMQLIRRSWRVRPDGPPVPLEDCTLAQCRVAPEPSR
jgi:hypothetical protein